MEINEIKEKLEQAYNEENWNIVEELIDSLSYHVEINNYGDDDWASPKDEQTEKEDVVRKYKEEQLKGNDI